MFNPVVSVFFRCFIHPLVLNSSYLGYYACHGKQVVIYPIFTESLCFIGSLLLWLKTLTFKVLVYFFFISNTLRPFPLKQYRISGFFKTVVPKIPSCYSDLLQSLLIPEPKCVKLLLTKLFYSPCIFYSIWFGRVWENTPLRHCLHSSQGQCEYILRSSAWWQREGVQRKMWPH